MLLIVQPHKNVNLLRGAQCPGLGFALWDLPRLNSEEFLCEGRGAELKASRNSV